jgi:hypothetical protein
MLIRRGDEFPSQFWKGNPIPSPLFLRDWIPAIVPLDPTGQLGGVYIFPALPQTQDTGFTGPKDGSMLEDPSVFGGVRSDESPTSIFNPRGKDLITSLVASKLIYMKHQWS